MNIALTGYMRSGKDSVGAYLVENYGYARFAFGDELKRYYHELFGRAEAKPREGYQWFGQTMRQRDPDIWVRKCFEKIDFARKTADALALYDLAIGEPARPLRAVITDLRQPNEYDRCRAEGFVIIRVSAPLETRIDRIRAAGDAFDPKDLTHETESHIETFDVDYEIVNDGTISELHAKVDAIMTEIAGAA